TVVCNDPEAILKQLLEQQRSERAKRALENSSDLPPSIKEALVRGDLKEAAVLLDQAIHDGQSQTIRLAEAYLARAELFVRQGQRPAAIPYYEKAYLLQQDVPKFVIAYASSLHEAGESNKAEQLLTTSIGLSRSQRSNSVEAQGNLADALVAL